MEFLLYSNFPIQRAFMSLYTNCAHFFADIFYPMPSPTWYMLSLCLAQHSSKAVLLHYGTEIEFGIYFTMPSKLDGGNTIISGSQILIVSSLNCHPYHLINVIVRGGDDADEEVHATGWLERTVHRRCMTDRITNKTTFTKYQNNQIKTNEKPAEVIDPSIPSKAFQQHDHRTFIPLVWKHLLLELLDEFLKCLNG